MLRHQQHHGHQLGGLHGRVRGWPAPSRPLPPLRHQDRRGRRRLRLDGGDAAPPLRPPPARRPGRGGRRHPGRRSRRVERRGGARRERGRPAGGGPARGGRRASPRCPTCSSSMAGKGQLGAAHAVLVEAGLGDIAVFGLAKRNEELFRPDRIDPIVMPRDSPTLFLVQRVRDEAHRFAITRHRARRAKSALRSRLDSCPVSGRCASGPCCAASAASRPSARRAWRSWPRWCPRPSPADQGAGVGGPSSPPRRVQAPDISSRNVRDEISHESQRGFPGRHRRRREATAPASLESRRDDLGQAPPAVWILSGMSGAGKTTARPRAGGGRGGGRRQPALLAW